MDYFNDGLTTFLGLEHFSVLQSMEGQKVLDLIILIWVLKTNESLTGLERLFMTGFSFLGE